MTYDEIIDEELIEFNSIEDRKEYLQEVVDYCNNKINNLQSISTNEKELKNQNKNLEDLNIKIFDNNQLKDLDVVVSTILKHFKDNTELVDILFEENDEYWLEEWLDDTTAGNIFLDMKWYNDAWNNDDISYGVIEYVSHKVRELL
jgi:hypothetical protein